jgi:hypothetical protein
MPMYVIERTFAEQLELTGDAVRLIEEVNADEGVRWLFSFLSADRRRSYCLYEAASPEAIMSAAERAGIPVDAVVEVDRISADMYAEREGRGDTPLGSRDRRYAHLGPGEDEPSTVRGHELRVWILRGRKHWRLRTYPDRSEAGKAVGLEE